MRAAAALVAGLLCCSTLWADDSLRCGRWLVSAPLSAEELLKKCGEPTSKRTVQEDVRGSGLNGTSVKIGTRTVEYWSYDRGRGAAPIVATIIEGRVERMQFAER